jgi:tetratricopeptide (TPR) repeat protein
MKSKVLLLVSSILISTAALAQKDELKTLKKIYGREKISDSDMELYKTTLVNGESLIAGSTEDDKVYFGFYKAMSPILELNLVMTKPENAKNPGLILKYLTVENVSMLVSNLNSTLAFEKKSGKQVYTKDIQETITSFKPMLVSYAVALSGDSKMKEAANVLASIYELDKTDVEKLYFAANYAVNAKEYEKALKYYGELKSLNFTGECTQYYAKNVLNEKEDYFGNTPEAKTDRESKIKLKLYSDPRDEKIPSKRPEIFKSIALILLELGKSDEAKQALKEARVESPEDVGLIISESNIYLKENDMVSYKKLISVALEKNPNNADLVFNLGVISYTNKELADAEKYYLKAIEIDPKYGNAYLNLAILKLDAEKILIDKMNKLGTSAPEMKKYDVLKKQREDVYKSAIPYLKKVVELDPQNVEAIKTLIGVYNAIELFDEAKALKALLKK